LTPEPQTPDTKRQPKAKGDKVQSEPVLSSKLRKATRHEDHWYLDDSIIIHIEGVLFRLHRSALARKSSYFADVYEKYGHTEGLEKMCECPVVEADGSARDFAILLIAMDDGMCVFL